MPAAGVERAPALGRSCTRCADGRLPCCRPSTTTRRGWRARVPWRAGWCGSCTTRRCGSRSAAARRWPRAPVLHLDGGLLDGGVGGEVGADELAVEGPVVLGVGGGMHAGEAAARADVALEGGLLGGVEHVSGGVEEDHRLVPGEVGGGEGRGVLGRGDREAVRRAQVADRLDARRDGVVSEARRLGEDEHVVRGSVGGDCRARGNGAREHCCDDDGCAENSAHVTLPVRGSGDALRGVPRRGPRCRVHFWLAAVVQVHRLRVCCRRSCRPLRSRHLPELGLRRVPLACGAQFCAPLPLQVYSWIFVPSAVAAPATSRHLPRARRLLPSRVQFCAALALQV